MAYSWSYTAHSGIRRLLPKTALFFIFDFVLWAIRLHIMVGLILNPCCINTCAIKGFGIKEMKRMILAKCNTLAFHEVNFIYEAYCVILIVGMIA